jgi:hypothetical protein
MEKLAAKSEIVQHKNCNLLDQFEKGKKKHQSEMNFVEKLQEEEGIGGLIFSSSKITQLTEFEAEKAQEKVRKKGNKLAKQWTTFYHRKAMARV